MDVLRYEPANADAPEVIEEGAELVRGPVEVAGFVVEERHEHLGSPLREAPLLAAQRALDEWLAYASRSKLAPFVKLARTIRRFRTQIEATIEWRLTNGLAESKNASIGRIRTNVRGFHDPEAFITPGSSRRLVK